MFKKVLVFLKNEIKTNYKSYLLLLFTIVFFLIRFDYVIYSSGSLIDLTDRIEVENSYKQEGSFNLTYVTARNANLFGIVLSYIIDDWDLESLDDMRIDDESSSEIDERNKIYLKETSYDAIIAAFSEAGIDYQVLRNDITITYIMKEAITDLKVNDIIKEVNGIKINNVDELHNEISKYKEGDKISIKVQRGKKEVDCTSTLIKLEDRVLVGFSFAVLKDIKTTPKVEYIFKDSESGSSRGLMCALDIYNKITEFDLTKGRIISGTGSIDENGVVGPIDGVKYKLKGAVKNKADIFIVPTKNYEEAIKLKNENNYDIEIIEATTLHDVIEKLNN